METHFTWQNEVQLNFLSINELFRIGGMKVEKI
jgi:hypothetical protein